MPANKQELKAAIAIARTRQELLKIKKDVQALFIEAFGRPLSDKEWEHYYLESPLGLSTAFYCYDGQDLLAHGGLIPQELISCSQEVIPYYLQTGIMVRKQYQTLVLFKELMDAMGAYVMRQNSFVIAFPNDKTYLPFVKMCGWHCARTFAIHHYEYTQGSWPLGDDQHVTTPYTLEIRKTPEFLEWRGSLNGLSCLNTPDFTIYFKNYKNSFEILDIKPRTAKQKIPLASLIQQHSYKTANVPECFLPYISLKDMLQQSTVGITQRMCFYPGAFAQAPYELIAPSLLLSDVF